MKIVDEIYWYAEDSPGDCNTYIINDKMITVIDPGTFLEKLSKGMAEDNLDMKKIQLIINTHTHPDHCGANQTIKNISHAKIALYKEEANHLNFSKEIAGYFGMRFPEFKIDLYLNDTLSTGKLNFQVIHTPGHSPGAICLYNSALKTLICGDLIFEGSVGRTDLSGGNSEELKKSIEYVSQLDVELVLPGHMSPIVGKKNVEKNFNYIKRNFFNFL